MIDKQAIRNFLMWEKTSQDTIDFKKCYVDLADDLVGGLLLSQIVYWHLPSSNSNKTKLRVKKENHLWIAKGRDDWYDEIRISPKQFDRASKILVDKGLIEKKNFKFDGSPTTHIRLIWENFLPALEEVVYSEEIEEELEEMGLEPLSDMEFTQREKTNLPKGEERSLPKGKNQFDQRGRTLTESTTEITSENEEEEDIITLVSVNSFLAEQINKRQISNQKTITAIFEVAAKCKAIGTTDRQAMENYCITVVEDKMKTFGQKSSKFKTSKKSTRIEPVPDWLDADPQAKEENSSDFEERKRKLEERLKKYKKQP